MLLIGSKGVGKHTVLESIVGKEKRHKLVRGYDGYNFIDFHTFNVEINSIKVILSFHILNFNLESQPENVLRFQKLLSNIETPKILLFIFDITEPDSLEEVLLASNLINNENSSSVLTLVLIGNKIDLKTDSFVNDEVVSKSLNYMKKKSNKEQILYEELNSLNILQVQMFFRDKILTLLANNLISKSKS